MTQRQKFHTDDANECLRINESGSHGVPNINLSSFTCLLVDFGKVYCCVHLPTSSSKTQMLLLEKIIFQNIDCFARDSSRLHLTFVAFCLLSVIRKQ